MIAWGHWGEEYEIITEPSTFRKKGDARVDMGDLDWDPLSHQYFMVNFDAFQDGFIRFGQKCRHTVRK